MVKRNTNPLALPLPIFTGENYDVWSIKMKTYFLSQDLWDIIVNYEKYILITDSTLSEQQQQKQLRESKKKDAAALFSLQQAVDDNIFRKISRAQKAKEAWDALKEEFQGIPDQTTTLAEGREPEDFKKYLSLYKVILKGDLKSVQKLCDEDENALEARITVNLDTPLHVAVGTGKANHIVEYLLNKMSMHQLSLKNKEGNTVLSIAAIVGNVPAAGMIFIKDENRTLIQDTNNSKRIPLVEAALHGQKEMVNYLLKFGKHYTDYDSATRFTSGVLFVKLLINAEFYDLALDFLNHRPSLATATFYGGDSLLREITRKPSAFPSGGTRKLPFWEYFRVSKVISYTKNIGETKLMRDYRVLELVKKLCKVIADDKNDYRTAYLILKRPLLLAVELGVYEIVEEIIKSYPDAIWFMNEKNQNLFHLAVMNRQEKVFNLIYGLNDRKHLLLISQDVDKNNILHLAGKLAPENKLNAIPGAALQMQHELRWFKDIEKILEPAYKLDKNCIGETPVELFTKAHRELVKEGRDWLKVVANSSSVAAALIATIVFAAAITVPGDYNDAGLPNFYKQIAFTTFSVSDAVSFFSSIASIIMFLSILTARYAEDDFLFVLPKRLIWGLVMLLLSLISLMVAFCATVYLVFCDRKAYWILAPMFVSALVPVSLFASSEYPLLWDLMVSTYGPGIIRKERTFYEMIKELVSHFFGCFGCIGAPFKNTT